MTNAPDVPADARRRLGLGAVVVLVLAAFAVVVLIGLLRGATGAEVVVGGEPSTTTSAVVEPAVGLYVHVTGAVGAPGLYRLDAGARVVDAVASAGGFADDADRAAVNLARAVSDGEQIVVPILGAAPAAGGTAGSAGGGPLDLNTATVDDLDTLPRIGPAIADRIIAWREQNGRFTSVDDLLSVPGIGEKMLAGLRDLVRV